MGGTLFQHIFYTEHCDPSTIDAIDCLPPMDELDAEPMVEDLSKAIDSLASGKAPGSDGIPLT